MVLYGDSRFDKNKNKFISEATIKKKSYREKKQVIKYYY